jgi:hypothetical protein
MSCRRTAGAKVFIPFRFQDELKARRVFGRWLGASEAHIRSDL